MMRSLWTAASGMRAQQVNVDTIANNVANINTIGYKSQQASFKSLLYQNLQSNVVSSVGAGAAAGAAIQVSSMSLRMAMSFVTIFPILCVYPFMQRFFTKGIMLGAVKG